MENQKLQYLTLAALARKLDLPHSRAQALLEEGVLKPTATVGRSTLFDPQAVSDFRRAIRSAATRPRIN